MNRRSFCEGLIAAVLAVVWPINRTGRQAAAFVSETTQTSGVRDIVEFSDMETGKLVGWLCVDADEPLYTTMEKLQDYVMTNLPREVGHAAKLRTEPKPSVYFVPRHPFNIEWTSL